MPQPTIGQHNFIPSDSQSSVVKLMPKVETFMDFDSVLIYSAVLLHGNSIVEMLLRLPKFIHVGAGFNSLGTCGTFREAVRVCLVDG